MMRGRIVPGPLQLALALLIAPWRASAAPPPAAAPPDTLIVETAVVTVRGTRPVATPGGASGVEVALDSARVRPAPTLEQALRAMPLVVIRANSRGEAQPALRGGDDRQIAVLVDGVPITLGWDHRTDLSIVPLAAATRITLTRGLSSLLHGPNVLGGAVHVDVTRETGRAATLPPLVLDAGAESAGGRSVAISGGARSERSGGRWVARAGAGFRRQDGVPLASGLARDDAATSARTGGALRRNSDARASDGYIALRRETPTGAWTSFMGSGYRAERGVPPETHVAEPRLWRYPFQARGLAALSAGTGMRATPWGRGDLEASFGMDAGRTEIDTFDDLDYATITGGERDDDRTMTARLLGDHTLGPRADLRAAAILADVRHDETLTPGGSGRYRQRLWSVACETEWRTGVGGAPARLSAGVSTDGSDTPESADKPALDRLWDWGARAGATVALAEGRVRLHGSASRRARFPSLRELYSGSLGRFLPNPSLRPEVLWVGEGGLTAGAGIVETQVVAFHQRMEDAIVRASVSTPGGSKFQRVNRNSLRTRGIEALARVRFATLEVAADATLQRVRELDDTGRESRAEYEAGASGGVGLEMTLPARLRAGVAARMMGRQFGLHPETGALETLAPTARWDARLSRAFALPGVPPWRQADVTLAIDNLADQPILDQLGLPQPGRAVRVQVRLW